MPGRQELSELLARGEGLYRPECVLCTAQDDLIVPDWSGNGGVVIVRSTGKMESIQAADDQTMLRPNGIALLPDGAVLAAHLGAESGGVFRLDRDGTVTPVLTEVDGTPLPPTNFVCHDAMGRLWMTVSTRRVPRADAYRADVGDGFVVLLDGGVGRIVADGLGYTNECAVSPDGAWLYVNETFARRLSRFRLKGDGSLGPRETVTEFGPGTFPDGLSFDCEGGIWITSVVSNRVIRIDAEGGQSVVLEDCTPDHLEWVEEAYRSATMQRAHLDTDGGSHLHNISSLAFGSPDRRTAWLGCLLGDKIKGFRVPVAGVEPVHWHYQI